jgi:hypothetical protein
MTLTKPKRRIHAVAANLHSLSHSNRRWLIIAMLLFGIGLWLHGEHGTVAATMLALRDRILDALGDVFMDRGINS